MWWTPGADLIWRQEQNRLRSAGDIGGIGGSSATEQSIISGLKTRLQSLERTGGFLKDVRLPSVAPYTPVAPSLGRISSLRDFISSGDTARLQTNLRRSVALAQNRAYPEAAFAVGKMAEGYGKAKADISAKAYGTAQQMHLGEVTAENVAMRDAYQMRLDEAMRAYDLDLKKAEFAENERSRLLETIDKIKLSSAMKEEQRREQRQTPKQSYARPTLSASAGANTVEVFNPLTGRHERLNANDPRVAMYSQYNLELAARREKASDRRFEDQRMKERESRVHAQNPMTLRKHEEKPLSSLPLPRQPSKREVRIEDFFQGLSPVIQQVIPVTPKEADRSKPLKTVERDPFLEKYSKYKRPDPLGRFRR